MQKLFFVLIGIIFLNTAQAQKYCIVQNAKAYYYEVLSGVNNTVIDLDGNETTDKNLMNFNISVYLSTNCTQPPFITSSTFGKMKFKLEFIRVKSNKDEVGKDNKGNLQTVEAPNGTFLWKANYSLKSKIVNFEKYKIILKGTFGSKKFICNILSIQKLQTLPMY